MSHLYGQSRRQPLYMSCPCHMSCCSSYHYDQRVELSDISEYVTPRSQYLFDNDVRKAAGADKISTVDVATQTMIRGIHLTHRHTRPASHYMPIKSEYQADYLRSQQK